MLCNNNYSNFNLFSCKHNSNQWNKLLFISYIINIKNIININNKYK